MVSLNLPAINLKLTKEGSKIFVFDIFRKKKILLTPEEWVRQHFAYYLTTQLHYPKSLMKLESGLKYNQRAKRSDIVVYNRQSNPLVLVECKSYQQKLDQKVLDQVSLYNKTLKAQYLAISNGLQHYFFEIDYGKGDFHQLKQLPDYELLIKGLD